MEAAATAEAALDFDPSRRIDWTPHWHTDTLVVPWGANAAPGARRAAGLFDNQGRLLPQGHCYRYMAGSITIEPELPEDADTPEQLPGQWLFGGLFYGHFGHFLVETTSRLWALEALEALGGVDGIIFHPKNQFTHERRQYKHLEPFFDALGLSHLQLRAPQSPVRVEKLAVPDPGFGIAEMAAGRPEYRDWMRANLGQDIAPNAAEDIYISRSELPAKRGSVVLESRIEALMEDAGYTVFHPQNYPLEAQIATYKGARRIVSLDASSLHLAAMLVPTGAKVAILNRGPSNNIEDYVRQFRHFAQIDPLRIEAVTGFFHPTGRRIIKRETHALLDFPAVGQALEEAGFIASASGWTTPDTATITAATDAIAARLDEPLGFFET
ncbi:glycosyltransferase family 61 protein [Maritalea mobilis]|uniref:glycosyltransferase family 61 protein n=1 Tax=Maritalea mobilis TaxID=483324 RepID=UPI0021BBE400|nr:glycosyltransferase family 61 protein [Maritalea mobilis]